VRRRRYRSDHQDSHRGVGAYPTLALSGSSSLHGNAAMIRKWTPASRGQFPLSAVSPRLRRVLATAPGWSGPASPLLGETATRDRNVGSAGYATQLPPSRRVAGGPQHWESSVPMQLKKAGGSQQVSPAQPRVSAGHSLLPQLVTKSAQTLLKQLPEQHWSGCVHALSFARQPGQGMAQMRGLSRQQPGTRAHTWPVGQSPFHRQPGEMQPSPSEVLSEAARQYPRPEPSVTQAQFAPAGPHVGVPPPLPPSVQVPGIFQRSTQAPCLHRCP
jgi:hypothetical protein